MKYILTLLLTVLCTSSVFAQTSLGVEPPVALHDVVPGQTVTFQLKIGNPSPKPLRIRVSLGDWNYNQFGELLYFAVGKGPSSASIWTKISSSVLEIAGQDVVSLRYTVQIPTDAKAGSHWGMVFFNAESSAAEPGIVNAAMSVRVAHTFYVNVAPVKSSGKITGIFGKPGQNSKSNYIFAVQYQNTGNIAQILEGRIEIRDSSGKLVSAAIFRRQVILPGALRILQTTLNGPLPAGDYTALVVLNYGDKSRDVAGEYNFTLKAPLSEP